jgi:hypothetical protein
MGKILTYLKVSEDNQSRDVLDAERLLEGMQAIYATSPSGSKKDNFAIPLAEMTKIFIEKVKGIAPKEEPKEEPEEEEDDTFKVGDMYYVGKEGTSKIYQVTLVEGQNFTFVRGNDDGTIESYEGLYSTDEANAKLKDGKWVKILKEKEESEWNAISAADFIEINTRRFFELNDADYYDIYSNETLQKKYIDFMNNLIDNSRLSSFLKSFVNDSKSVSDFLSQLSKKSIDDENEKYQIIQNYLSLKRFFGEKIYKNYLLSYDTREGFLNPKFFEESKEDSQFKIGDKYLNKTVKDTFTIIQVYTDFIDVKFTGGNEATYDMMLCKEKVADGTWVKVLDEEKEEPKNYKVGDKFLWAKEDITFVIDFIKNGELGIIYSDGLTGFISTEQFEKGLSTGYYKPYKEEAKPEEKKTRKPRQPRTKSEQDKKIEHILDINLDEIQF